MIIVAELAVKGEKDYAGLSAGVGEDLACWPCWDVRVGRSVVAFSVATELVVVCGRATFVVGELRVEVRAGSWLRMAAGTSVQCEVSQLVSFRSHAPSLRELGTVSAGLPSLARGGFVSLPTPLPEGSPYRDGLVYLARRTSTGPLSAALFAIPRAELRLSRLELDVGRLDGLFSWGPTGVAHRPKEAGVPPVLARLQATGHAALTAISSLAIHGGDAEVLERTAFVLGLGPLDHGEELFMSRGATLLRWMPSEDGASVLEAIGWSAGTPPIAPAHTEAIVEHLLSSLWRPGDDDDFYRWMRRPLAVPYDIAAFCCPYLDALSPAFRARWNLGLTCAAADSALDADFVVSITCLDAGSTWRIRWTLEHEHVEWKYRIRVDGDVVTSARVLVDQHD